METAWQSSLATFNAGKRALAPMPLDSNVSQWVTFGPTTVATTPPATVTIPAPTVATATPAVTMVPALVTAPTMMYITSCAVEFGKGDDGSLVIMRSFRIVSCGQSGITHSWVMPQV